jgi:hypothetical protein
MRVWEEGQADLAAVTVLVVLLLAREEVGQVQGEPLPLELVVNGRMVEAVGAGALPEAMEEVPLPITTAVPEEKLLTSVATP